MAAFGPFADLGCGVCGEAVDENGVCIDCGYDPLAEDDDDYWASLALMAGDEFSLFWPPMVELGPVGKEALG